MLLGKTTRRMRLALGILLCGLCTVSCTTLPFEPDSPVLAEHEWGTAGGQSPEEVSDLANIVESVLPLFREMRGFVDSPLRIHLVEHVGVGQRDGLTVEMPFLGQWVSVRRGSPVVPFVVAHEMAHFYFQDYQDLFPAVLEEGVCDLLATEIYTDNGAGRTQIAIAMVSYLEHVKIEMIGVQSKVRAAQLLLDVPSIEELLDYEGDDLLDINGDVAALRVYGIGRMLAVVIGIQGLQDLAERCEDQGLEMIPSEWILEAAGLVPPSQDNLLMAFRQALGEKAIPTAGQPPTITLAD